MRRLIGLVVGLTVAGLFLGWNAHGRMIASFEQGCVDAGNVSAVECACAAEAFGDALPFWQLAGTGSFRPFVNDEVLSSAAAEADRICLGQVAS